MPKRSKDAPLTKRQTAIYEFLKSRIKEDGYPPSVREICAGVGLSSTSSVHSHLATLEKKGFIRHSKSKNRSIEILEKDFYYSGDDYQTVPIIGKVTAGQPILAFEDIQGFFPIPIEYIGNHEVFMLKVSGDSMTERGVMDKDMVLVKKQPTAMNGEMVVALIDDSATVKTFYKERSRIRLQPENSAYEPIYADDVTILGVVIGLYRRY